jgi:hypothetical protein
MTVKDDRDQQKETAMVHMNAHASTLTRATL